MQEDLKLPVLLALCAFDEFAACRAAAASAINALFNVSEVRNFPVPLEQ